MTRLVFSSVHIWEVLASPLSIAVSDPPEALLRNEFHLAASRRCSSFVKAASVLYWPFEEDWVLLLNFQ